MISRHTGILALLVVLVGISGCASKPQQKTSPEEALVYASARGDTALVETLLDAGLNPGIRDENDLTPLLYATEAGHTEIVELLLAKGADVNATATADAATPLMRAASNGHTDILAILLRAGAHIDQQDRRQGATALMWAAFKDQEECAKLLLQAGALVDVRGRRGETALWLATANADSAMVGVLLRYGADPNLADVSGSTPVTKARQRNDQEMLRQLYAHGAK